MLLADIIAQPRAIEALHIALASPYPCSLLMSGASGVGKSALLSAVRSLPWERRVLSLPATLSAEELGAHSDIEETLRQGRLIYHSSLPERIWGSVVLIDNAHLMSPEVLARLLDLQASSPHDRPTCLIAAVNTEEGGLRSTLLDRFDMYVELAQLRDPLVRIQVMRQAMRSEASTAQLDHDTALKLRDYRERCLRISPTDSDFVLAAELCRNAFVLGHRADIALLRTASVYATMQERTTLLAEDFAAVKDLVLVHRINNTQSPTETPDDSPRQPDETPPPRENTPPEYEPLESPHSAESSGATTQTNRDAQQRLGIIPEQREDIASIHLESDPISLLARHSKEAVGLGSRLKSLAARPRGRYYKSTVHRTDASYKVALLATIREAIPYQRQRRELQSSELAIIIASSDLRYKLCRRRTGYHILFAVDASGSMGAQKRMHRVKGLIIELLRRAYEERDYVGLLTFRADEAKLILPLTKSIARAHTLLKDLQTGGRTPLYLGLSRSLEVLQHAARKGKGVTPVLVVVTDGRATSRYPGENSPEALRQLGWEFSYIGAKILVIDSEEGFIRMGKARQLAEHLGASACYPMEQLIQQSAIKQLNKTTQYGDY
ncbi:MAG: VWA domain-containing protein [Porphyromonadaceae bacterium]|nr:VWA domain-containing protein [Porphyromonadaceae bacterium]